MKMIKRFIATTLHRKNPFDKDALMKVVSNPATDWKIGDVNFKKSNGIFLKTFPTTNNFLYKNSSILDLYNSSNQMVKRSYSKGTPFIDRVFIKKICALRKTCEPERSKKARLLLDDSTSILDVADLKKAHKEIRKKRAKEIKSKVKRLHVMEFKKLKNNLKSNGKSVKSSENEKKGNEDNVRPPSAPKFKKPYVLCPPIKKSEGSCIRVKYTNCDESCKYFRKYCGVRERQFNASCRIRAPYPSFVECMKPFIYINKSAECFCGNHESNPCDAWRIRRKPPKIKSCG